MNKKKLYQGLIYLIAAVWLVNGLLCKVLNLVPRHGQIVASILGDEHARLLTILIGISEVVMAVWIISGYKSRFSAMAQIVVVATMNILEYMLVPDLLLWGKLNSLFAFMFVLVVYINEFYINHPKPNN